MPTLAQRPAVAPLPDGPAEAIRRAADRDLIGAHATRPRPLPANRL